LLQEQIPQNAGLLHSSDHQGIFRGAAADRRLVPLGQGMGTELEFVIMVIAVSCVKLLSAHNSTQHTSRKHKV
jgi:hypothetical protein